MSVYVTGDTHGTIYLEKLLPKNLEKYQPGDTFIILGDFSLIFAPRHSNIEKKYITLLSELPYQFCFIDGDRENYDRLNAYEIESWNGGNVHKITNNIIHLLRGEAYTIEDISILCMGGASTIQTKEMRASVLWMEENITEEDILNANQHMKEKNSIDYVLTHTCPSHIAEKFRDEDNWIREVHPEKLEQISYLRQKIEDMNCLQLDVLYEQHFNYQHWYFGHFHQDIEINNKFTCVFDKIIPLTKSISL